MADVRSLRVALHPDTYPNGAQSTLTRSTRREFSCAACGRHVKTGEPSVSINTLLTTRICLPCAEAHLVQEGTNG